jgi:exonuclease VII small subunit
VSYDDALGRAEELLERLEATRAELESLSGGDDPERALAILGELAELGKQVEAELQRARQQAERDADA